MERFFFQPLVLLLRYGMKGKLACSASLRSIALSLEMFISISHFPFITLSSTFCLSPCIADLSHRLSLSPQCSPLCLIHPLIPHLVLLSVHYSLINLINLSLLRLNIFFNESCCDSLRKLFLSP